MGALPEEITGAWEDVTEAVRGWQENLFTHSLWYTLIVAAIAGVAAFVIIKLVDKVLSKYAQGNLRFFYRLIDVAVILIAVLMVMMTIQPLASMSKALLAGSGLIAVVIGIAAQASLGNVFSGIVIGISRPFVIGETIEIVGQSLSGTVVEIGLRQTVIKDVNNKRIVVPNSVIDKAIIRTVHYKDQAIVNFLQVGISYGSDMDRAIAIMKRAVLAHKDYYDTRTKAQQEEQAPKDVAVAVTELGESAVTLRASVWSKDAGTGFMMLSDLRQTLLRAFKKEGIEIPYPYRNVVVHTPQDETSR